MALSLALVLSVLAVQPAAAQEEPEARILVFSKTTNFYHDSIPDGIAAIEQMGEENNWEIVVPEAEADPQNMDGAGYFNDEDLATFDAVVFNNTNSIPGSGDLLNSEQRAAFQRYIQGGGGFAGIHAATATERDWSWYEGLVGTIFTNHPSGTNSDGTIDGRVKVTDRVHPSTAGLPELWEYPEEWYNWGGGLVGDVHVLAWIDVPAVDSVIAQNGQSLQEGPNHPYAWCQAYDGGRSWYTNGGHSSAAFSNQEYLSHLEGGIAYAAGVDDAGDCGATVESAFERTQLATEPDLGDAFEIDVAEDGSVFYIQRTGQFRRIDPETGEISLLGDLDLGFNPDDPDEGLPVARHSDGLTGFALSPEFADNGWLYALYADPDEYLYHLSRFTYDAENDVLDMASEQRMLDFETERYEGLANVHMGGSVEFGPDGSLYFSTGDNTDFSQSNNYTPIDERPGRAWNDAQRTSGNTNDLRGKVVRIMPTDDGGYDIPDGNLFPPETSDPELTRPEIYAMGFRNPFRITVDQVSGELLVGDYGPDAGSSNPNRGPEGLVEWNVIGEAGNYGWPYCVGNNIPYIDYDFATGESSGPFDCEGGPINDSPNNTGLEQLPPAQEADIWYGYGLSPEFPELGTGGAAPMSGPVYHYDDELDSDTKFPEYYDGKWFVFEYARNFFKTVSRLTEDVTSESFDDRAAGDPLAINPFMDSASYTGMFDALFGPDGSLYVLDFGGGSGVGRGSTNTNAGIYRIDYVGDDGAIDDAPGDRVCPTDGSDTFDDELDLDRWSDIVRHDPDGYHVEDGQLVLPTAHGDMFGSDTDAPNLILQPGVSGRWSASTQVTLDATTGFQQAGLMVYVEDATFAKAFLMGRPDGTRRLSFVVQTDGVARNADSDWFTVPEEFPSTFQLRLDSDGTEMAASYSTDGSSWMPLGRPASVDRFEDASLGIFASSGGGGDTNIPVIDASFDWFELAAAPSPDDDFEGGELDLCRWSTTIGHDPDGYTVEGGQLTLPTAHGDLTGSIFNAPNLILQPAPDGAWEAETEMTFDPDTGYQQAGLLLHADEQNFAKLTLMGRPGTDPNRISMFSVTDGTERNQSADWSVYPDDGPTTLRVRLTSDGSAVSASYSTDGEEWTDVGRSYSLGEASNWNVGVFASSGGAGDPDIPVIDAAFDWFTLSDSDGGGHEPNEPPSPPAGYEALFDHNTLDGWTKLGGGDFLVTSDGTLQTCCGGGGLLWYSDRSFGDFRLHLEYKMNSATDNSGVFMRFPAPLDWEGSWSARPDDTVRGYEAQIEDNPTGGDPQKTGSIYNNARVEEVLANPIGEWNTYEIQAVGDTYTIWLNGELVNEFEGDGSRDLEGHLGLQAHHDGSDVEFRNMWIRDLDDPVQPSVEASLEPAAPDGEGGWYVTPVSLSLASDHDDATLQWRMSGDEQWITWTEPVVFDADGANEIEYRAVVEDGGGSQPDAVTVDVASNYFDPDDITVAEGGTVSFELVDGFHNVEIYDEDDELVAGNEPGSDWGTFEFAADEAGSYRVECEPHVSVGMVADLEVIATSGEELASEIGSVSFDLDQTPPETTASVDGDQDGDAYEGEATVSLDADDATSGVAETHVRESGDEGFEVYDGPVTFTGEGSYTVEFRSADVAGNVEDWQSVTFTISEEGDPDPDVPQVSVDLDPAEPDGAGGWYTSPVSVTVSSDDGDAALEWRYAGDDDWMTWSELVTVDEDGSYELEARASNAAGTSEVTSVSFDLDQTPPETTASVDGDQDGDAYEGEATVSLDADDATSGVAETHVRESGDEGFEVYDGPVTFTGEGSYTVEFRSADVAGNVEDWQSVTFTISEDGGPTEPPVGAPCDRVQGGGSFPDAPGSGHKQFIDCLLELGIVEGYDDGTFGPADDVSRGQLASFVVRAIEHATGETMSSGGSLFPDVGVNSTHGPAIYKLRNAGIIRGYEDGLFRPRDAVSRDQTARYVVGALELVIGEPLPTSGASFPDVPAGSQYSVDIDQLVTAEVVSGFTDGTFGPREPVTRGQMTRFIGNALGVLATEGAYAGP